MDIHFDGQCFFWLAILSGLELSYEPTQPLNKVPLDHLRQSKNRRLITVNLKISSRADLLGTSMFNGKKHVSHIKHGFLQAK